MMAQTTYVRIFPPREVRAIEPDAVPPLDQWIDYDAHPAYRGLDREASLTDRLDALWRFGRQAVVMAGKRLIRYEMIPVSLRRPRGIRGLARFASAAVSNLLPSRGGSIARSELAEQLDMAGCVVTMIPLAEYSRLERLAAPAFAELERRRRQNTDADRDFDESRAYYDQQSANDLFAQIRRVFVESGVMNAASAYLGRPAELVDINPQINDRSDSFWRRIFPDLELGELPSAAYFHRDASGGDLKAIIYMTDVGAENGPFTYCIGSNKLRPGRVLDLVCEINDSNGLSATDRDRRRAFASLPRGLRRKGAFGNDVVAGSAIEGQLLGSAWSIEGQKGAIVLFDTKGIHRGGMVVSGERRVITCVIG